MEEERKRIITTEGLINANSLLNKQVEETRKYLAIPKEKLPEEAPGTTEQVKQFYNSEQWKDIRETVIRVGEKLIEVFKPVIETVAKVAVNIRDEIIKIYKADPEIKRCYGIYKRTRKRKNKKKANAQNI